MDNYIEITMETTENWVALGHNNVGTMVSNFNNSHFSCFVTDVFLPLKHWMSLIY